MSYFRLKGAYNDVQLQNTPSQYQNLKYPCMVEYPDPPTARFCSDDALAWQGVEIPSTTVLVDEYKALDETYLYNVQNPAYR